MTDSPPDKSRWPEVFAVFLGLGLTSFGGPVAHLGYFRQAFVIRRQWLSEAAYAELVALCQFLPGPASSQVGFAIGLMRAGALGGVAAWLAFTAPSAALLTLFAFTTATLKGPLALGLLHGLKLVAVMIVGQAVFGMARTLTPDAKRVGIAVAAAGIVTIAAAAAGQIMAIAAGAVAGAFLCRGRINIAPDVLALPVSRRAGLTAFGLFLLLLFGLPALAALTDNLVLTKFDAFYRSGALVFGGGHVVLPLLKEAVVDNGWINSSTFLAGYGAAQAVPGPLFTFAAYLGAVMSGAPSGAAGALMGVVAIMAPGLLVLLAALPFWAQIRTRPTAQAAMRGANAAVVGILACALYNPVWTSAVLTPADFAAALTGFVLLVVFKAPPLAIVLLGAGFGLLRAFIG